MHQVGLGPKLGRAGHAGLVLLYAEEFAQLPGAWPLVEPRTTVGRDAGANIQLPVSAVSRMHAALTLERGHWMVTDLGSRNGVLVDGHSVQTAALENGAEIRIGDAVLKFVEDETTEYCRYRIDGAVVGQPRLCSTGELVGGFQIDRISAELARISQTNLSVVLLGESGTGKEVVARELHRHSGRKGAFHAVNCAAIPAALLESELFGYKRGAFSGAERDKPGLIRMADQGTLLLDEIGDMPIEAQAKLLRVLQSREVFPLGATTPEKVDIRVICATHRDLLRLITAEKFREDLYARLNEYQLRLPPLRDRKEDIYQLSLTFLRRYARPDLRLTFGYVLGLISYDWPYNVRELEACIKRSIALADGPLVGENLLPEPIRELMADYGKPLPAERISQSPVDEFTSGMKSSGPTEAALRELLVKHGGNVAAVGRELGKARMQIHRWMDRYGINVDDFR